MVSIDGPAHILASSLLSYVFLFTLAIVQLPKSSVHHLDVIVWENVLK